jgi:sporulation protein YlmC with PRC-barrel domain
MSTIQLGRDLLDHQLIDSDGRRCGKVDDLAIEGGAGEKACVVAILCGPGVWPQRSGWVGRVAARLGGRRRVRVPWDEVAKIDSAVRLRQAAPPLGLGRGDDRARRLIEKLPGAER